VRRGTCGRAPGGLPLAPRAHSGAAAEPGISGPVPARKRDATARTPARRHRVTESLLRDRAVPA